MPFLDDVEEMRAKTPAGGVPFPVLVGIAAVALIVVVLAGLQVASSARGGFVVEAGASSSLAASSSEGSDEDSNGFDSDGTPASCYLYVVGAVREPGVYKVAADARVNDAVSAAGGLADDADAAAVNLARPVVDGEQIVIPVQGEQGGPAQGEGRQEGSAGDTSVSAASSGITPEGKVNINVATVEELQVLSGVGPATAEKIVASREAEGPFASKEDLKRVSGIGEKKYAALADSIAV